MTPKHRSLRTASRRAIGLAGLPLAVLLSAQAPAQQNPLTATPGGVHGPGRPESALGTDGAEAAEAQVSAPSATDIIRSLAPFVDGNPNGSRDVRDVDIDNGRRRVRVDYAHAIDVTVFFAYDSAQLAPQARIQLQSLGRALQSPELLPYGFLIAGHTDAAGDPSYNRLLSLRRASAVRDYLVRTFGIDSRRLLIHGWGPTRLKDPGNPLSGVNRRVEIALIETRRLSFYRDVPGRVAAARPLPGYGFACAGTRPDDPRLRTWRDLDDFGAWLTVLCPAPRSLPPRLGARYGGPGDRY